MWSHLLIRLRPLVIRSVELAGGAALLHGALGLIASDGGLLSAGDGDGAEECLQVDHHGPA